MSDKKQKELKSVTDKIRNLCLTKRHSINMPITKLSELSGVSLAALSKFENGSNMPRLENLFIIAKTLNIQDEVFTLLGNIYVSNSTKTSQQEIIKKDLIKYGLSTDNVEHVISYVEFLRNKS